MRTGVSIMCFYFFMLTLISGNIYCSENLSLGKTADSDSVLNGRPWGPDKAIDGNKTTNVYCGSCFHNQVGVSPVSFLRIDLKNISTLNRVEIYYREPTETRCVSGTIDDPYKTQNYRFKGYCIEISDSNNRNAYRCYNDTSQPYPALYQNNSCQGTGRYLSIVQRNPAPHGGPILELCEVEVYGCSLGYYGTNHCNDKCPTNCFNNICDPDTGHCRLGCNDGYMGDSCHKQCPNFTFSKNCRGVCNCRNNALCNYVSGSCPGGLCASGWNGTACNEECPDGTYGSNCVNKCGMCRDNGVCDKRTGQCLRGVCADGYKGPVCSEECDGFSYGYNCSERCGQCSGGRTCDHVTGECNQGCSAGYLGVKCIDPCTAYWYGVNCSTKCLGTCSKNESCHHATGRCPNGCDRGYQGLQCDQECGSGSYGMNCGFTCGQCYNEDGCNIQSGTCSSGCKKGWGGPLCQETLQTSGLQTWVIGVSGMIGWLVGAGMVILVVVLMKWKRRRGSSTDGHSVVGFRRRTMEEVTKTTVPNPEMNTGDYDTVKEGSNVEHVYSTIVVD